MVDSVEVLVTQTQGISAPEPEPAAPGVSSNIEGINFDEGATNAGSYSIPPDPIGAAGPNHVVSVINTSIEWHTKSGVQQLSQKLGTTSGGFFAPLSPVNGTFDPKVIYDTQAGRFVVVTLERVDNGLASPQAANTSRILVAVSDDSDPNGTWRFMSINSKATISGIERWADYPGLAVDEEAIYITNNMFSFNGNGGSYGGTRLWIINKTPLYTGGTGTFTVHDPFAGGGVATTAHPAHILGSPPSGATGTFLTTYGGISNGTDEFIQVVRVDNPLTTPTFNVQQLNVGNIDNTAGSYLNAPQSGTAQLVSTNDRRAINAVWRNNRLYTAATTLPGSGPNAGQVTARFWEFNTTTLAAITQVQSGEIGGEDIATGAYTFFPSITANGAGDICVGFAASAPTIFPGAYAVVRLSGDTPGTVRPALTVAAGTDFYFRAFGGTRNRWGDYSGTCVDPSNDSDFWIFNQYALARGTVLSGEDGRWGTRWAKIDVAAQTPTLTAPATASVQGIPTNVDFTLPEAAQAGSLTLTFTGSASRTLILATSQETAGTHSFSFDPTNPTASAAIASITGGASIPGGTYTVTLSYNDTLANGPASAASTDVVIGIPAPEIAVEQPEFTNIPDGGTKDFGSVAAGSSTSLEFTIKNTGDSNLTGLTFTKDGTNASDFTVTVNPTAPVIGGDSTTFTVRFAPSSAGFRTAAIHIANNDSDENPFDIILEGTGTGAGFVEQFEAGLTADGANTAPPGAVLTLATGDWYGLNLSSPIGTTGIFAKTDSNPFGPDASGLATYAGMNFSNGSNASPAQINTFLMSPTKTFNNGDTISFLTRTVDPVQFPDRLRLLFSTSGASTDAAVFTTTLLSVNEGLTTTDYPSTWTQFTATISGLSGPTSGRFALNYNVPDGGSTGTNSDFIGIDVVTYTPNLVPEIAVEQNLLDIPDEGSQGFGSVAVGSNSSLTFSIKNSGGADLTGLTITKNGANASDFTVTANPGAPVTGGNSTTFTVKFAPGGPGVRSAALHIASNDADENPFDITLSGTGVAVPEIEVKNPTGGDLVDGTASIGFANVRVQTSLTKTLTIKNTGTATLNNLAISVDGKNAANFTVTQPLLSVIPAGGSTTFTVKLIPTALGLRQAALHISSNDADENPFDIKLFGVGVAPEIAVKSPTGSNLTDGSSTFNFGSRVVNTAATKTFTIENTGTASLRNLVISKDGANAANFTITQPLLTVIPAGGSTTFTVKFKPSAKGIRVAAIHIASDDANENPFDIALTGTGLAPEIAVKNPSGKNLTDGQSTANLGSTVVKTSVTQTFKIKNVGNAKLKNLSITKNGKNSANFTVTQPLLTSLVSGASTSFTVTFTPSATGKRIAAIHIASNDSNENPFDLTLTGTGLSASALPTDPLAEAGLADLLDMDSSSNPDTAGLTTETSTDWVDGQKYLVLEVKKPTDGSPFTSHVEVSSDLLDWYSGSNHTTVIEDNKNHLKVRDNTPLTSGTKRYIRLK